MKGQFLRQTKKHPILPLEIASVKVKMSHQNLEYPLLLFEDPISRLLRSYKGSLYYDLKTSFGKEQSGISYCINKMFARTTANGTRPEFGDQKVPIPPQVFLGYR